MKVLLVSANREMMPYPVAPLGLAYVAGALIEAGHDVRLIDLCFEDDAPGAAANAAREFRPELIGISIRNIDNLTYPKSVFYLPLIKVLVEKLREENDCPIILGGSGFSLFPEKTLEYLGLNFGIMGDGEEGLKYFVDILTDGGDFSSVPNLVYREGPFKRNRAGFNGTFAAASPARHLLNNEKYIELGGMSNIQTKRGCPFKCIYCTYPLLAANKIRLREPAEIADEIEELRNRYGIDYIFFVDDIFNIPNEHAAGICEEIIRRNININWSCFATPSGINRELLQLIKRAGCRGIEFGTDGGTEETLYALGKGFSLGDVENAQRLCNEVGLNAAHYLILGGPAETRETIKETFSFMERLNPTAVIAMLGVRIYPNTELCRLAIREGILKEGESLLEPKFYISREVGDALVDMVENYAGTRPNWIVPGLDIRSSVELTQALRLLGKRGVLWDMLGKV